MFYFCTRIFRSFFVNLIFQLILLDIKSFLFGGELLRYLKLIFKTKFTSKTSAFKYVLSYLFNLKFQLIFSSNNTPKSSRWKSSLVPSWSISPTQIQAHPWHTFLYNKLLLVGLHRKSTGDPPVFRFKPAIVDLDCRRIGLESIRTVSKPQLANFRTLRPC